MSREFRFGLVLNPAEREALGKVADAEGGLSKAATVRRLIRQAALARGLWQPMGLQPDQFKEPNR